MAIWSGPTKNRLDVKLPAGLPVGPKPRMRFMGDVVMLLTGNTQLRMFVLASKVTTSAAVA